MKAILSIASFAGRNATPGNIQTNEKGPIMRMRNRFLAAILALALGVCLASCASQEPIIGTWKSSKTGEVSQYNKDGSFNYTSKAGLSLQGTWEPYDRVKTLTADGSEWKVYVVIPANRSVTGNGSLGNQHGYNDEYGDYYRLINKDRMMLAVGAGNIDRIAESHSFGDLEKEYESKRVN